MNRSKFRLEPDSCGPWEPYIRGVACRCHLRSLVPNCVNHVSRQHVNNTRQHSLGLCLLRFIRSCAVRCGDAAFPSVYISNASCVPYQRFPPPLLPLGECESPPKCDHVFFCYAYLYPCKPLVSVVISGLNYEL